MKPEAQRIAIAQACGWTDIQQVEPWVGVRPGGNRHELLPDYLCDLNAMHEAENTLPERVRLKQLYHELCHATNGMPCYATTAQRAEAFLRAKGLWL